MLPTCVVTLAADPGAYAAVDDLVTFIPATVVTIVTTSGANSKYLDLTAATCSWTVPRYWGS